jgi:hypothetical protein
MGVSVHLSTQMPELKEPAKALASAVDLRVLADQVEALAVQRAREQGWDWEEIASALHAPRKRLRARYAHRAQHG